MILRRNRPVQPGNASRLECIGAPSHVEDVNWYRARGDAMKGNRCAIVTDHDADQVRYFRRHGGKVDPGGLTVERCPSAPAWAPRS